MKTPRLQRLINFFYRNPKSKIKHIRRFGGSKNYRKMLAANDQMRKTSLDLPPVISHNDGLPVYFLTGKNFLHQTLFCIRSLQKYSQQKFRYIVIDDGSLDLELVKEKLPGALVITATEITANLEKRLPAEIYPVINEKRKVYPHLKKLTDIHTLPAKGYKLVLDSDMIFWREPAEIIQWLQKPSGHLFMTDSHHSYGYSNQLMEQLCGYPIPPLLNVGVAGIRSELINWQVVENWIGVLEAKEGGSYYLEQALTAMISAGSELRQLPASEYVVYPSNEQIVNCTGILHHYVDLSKKGYLMEAWQKLIE